MVVGAGVIGLSIARALHKRGAGAVTVIDRQSPGQEASRAAAGMLAPQAEADSPDEFFRLCRASNEMYPDFASQLFEETGIDVEFDDSGTLYLAFSEAGVADLRRRMEWQEKAGLRVEWVSGAEALKLEPMVSERVRAALFFQDDRQVENRKLVSALLAYTERNRIRVLPGHEVREIVSGNGQAPEAVTAKGEVFSADALVIATGAWTSLIEGAGPGAGVPAVRPVRGQMVAFRSSGSAPTRVVFGPGGYVVPRRSGRILAGATTEEAGFDDRVTEDGISSVVEAAYGIVPDLEGMPIEERWSGLRPAISSELPFISNVEGSEGVYAAVGHYRNGILLAPLTGEIVAGLILKGAADRLAGRFEGNQELRAA